MWPPSWIHNAEEGWGEKEISTKEVVDTREEGGGRGRGNVLAEKGEGQFFSNVLIT